ncbi:hypothetical protein [Corynebacterium glucuronolyticum]|uniref:hypothetical protein n=1 Tax=Corynebacterium glucuronolyticum TaxID=39791 RepID=UPI00223C1E07|nr:hypothetical protein [Corynebacterium glucuronolyticum]MCT1563110.1 hypothetical protein [Corynebacterium glucuronolyticum]
MSNVKKIPFGQDMVKPIQVPLSKLDLDLGNARFRSDAGGQAEAMALMLNSSGEKCMELLKDLCQRGNLSSSDIPIVVKEGNRYRVLEGNRRLTCLKLWKNPALLRRVSSNLADKYQKRIDNLANQSPFDPPKTMPVVVAKSVDEADAWIDKKHGLGKDGSSTVEWGAFEKDRRAARRTGKVGRALSFVQYLTSEFDDDAVIIGILDKLLSKQYTILDRVLNNAVLRDEIGITQDSSGLTTSKRSAETMRPLLLSMLSDFAEKRQTAKTLHTVDQISDYFHRLYLKYLKDLPLEETESDLSNGGRMRGASPGNSKSEENESIGNIAGFVHGDNGNSNSKPSQEKAGNNSEQTQQQKQKSKIFANLTADGFTEKIQRLIAQTAKLTVARQPDLIAVSLRVILDLTCTQYLKEFHPRPDQIKRNLDQKIIEVLKLLEPSCTQGVKEAEKTSEFAKLFAWTSSNKEALRLVQYALHDIRHVNTASDTMILADRYQKMLETMNEKLRQKKSS